MAVDVTREHRAAGDKGCGQVQPCCRHEQPRYVLVAVRDHNQSIEVVRLDHTLGGVCDQVAGDKRVLHAFVAHCDTVTDRDRGEDDRHATRLSNPELDGLSDLVDVHVARDDLIE